MAWPPFATIVAGLGTWFVIGTFRETRRTAKAAIDGVLAAERAAIAAERANDLAREVYLADQRPWLKVDAGISAPLIWDPANGGQLSFAFRVENVGRSPAINVSIHPEIILEPTMEYEKDQASSADRTRELDANGGTTIFPGQKISLGHGLSIPYDRMAKVAERCGGLRDWIHPVLIGCVHYRSLYGATRHETGFIYQVWRYVNGRPNAALGPSEGNIPAEELILMEWPRPGRIT